MSAVPNKRIRVLTLVDGIGTYGGGETLARQITDGLDPERFDRSLCVTRWEPLPEYQGALDGLRAKGVRFIGLERSSRFDLAPWRSLVRTLRADPVDVIHAHKIGSNIWGAAIARLLGTPLFIAHEHTWSYEGQPQRRFLDRELIARTAGAFVAVSQEDARRMHTVERIPERKIRFIPNGIPAREPTGRAAAIREELGVGPGTPLIGCVATLRPQKALDVLAKATAGIVASVPGARVVVVGGGDDAGAPEEQRLRGVVASLGVSDSFLLAGRRSDIPDFLDALDLAVLSSDFEGSPLSVMEYMAAGCAVVATAVGGVPDLVQEGVTGMLVPPQDPEALAGAVVELLGDPDRRAAMGEAGRRRQREEFSLDAMVRRVEDLYLELLPG